MRFLPAFVRLPAFARLVAVLTGVCGLATSSGLAQTFAASVSTQPPSTIVADSGMGRVTVPGHHRSAPEKLIYARVRDGVYTVDGMVAKIRLNYDVQGANYMYLFVPGVGTAVVSVAPEAEAIVTPAALQDDQLSFTVDDHHFNLTGVSLSSDKGQPPAHLYVRLDRSAWHLSRTPMVGFGSRAETPYEWPGALPAERSEESLALPPVPANLLPTTAAPAVAVPATSEALRPALLK